MLVRIFGLAFLCIGFQDATWLEACKGLDLSKAESVRIELAENKAQPGLLRAVRAILLEASRRGPKGDAAIKTLLSHLEKLGADPDPRKGFGFARSGSGDEIRLLALGHLDELLAAGQDPAPLANEATRLRIKTADAGLATEEGAILAAIKKMSDRTRNGGIEIVNLLKTGSAYYAPAASVVAMVGSILRDERRILPSCVWLTGEYGQQKVYAGVPAILGSRGVEKVVELPLAADERKAFQASCDVVRKGQTEIDGILG